MLKYNEFAYNQIQIIASPFVEKEKIYKEKRITLKRWMKGRNYHKRINKKLLKRHGVNISIPYVFSGGKLFAHPDNVETLRKTIGKNNETLR